jgi:hypothetical protein
VFDKMVARRILEADGMILLEAEIIALCVLHQILVG